MKNCFDVIFALVTVVIVYTLMAVSVGTFQNYIEKKYVEKELNARAGE
jgi:hypothetical protein